MEVFSVSRNLVLCAGLLAAGTSEQCAAQLLPHGGNITNVNIGSLPSLGTLGTLGNSITVLGTLLEQNECKITSTQGANVQVPAGAKTVIYETGATNPGTLTMQSSPGDQQPLNVICAQTETITLSPQSVTRTCSATSGGFGYLYVGDISAWLPK
jgi:hypothetical protein